MELEDLLIELCYHYFEENEHDTYFSRDFSLLDAKEILMHILSSHSNKKPRYYRIVWEAFMDYSNLNFPALEALIVRENYDYLLSFLLEEK